MDSSLRLELFGSPEASLGGQKLAGFITVKSKALLFYLAMKPGVHGRLALATLLWPETTEISAAKNLRNILSNLRKLVGAHITITRQTVAFRRDAAYFLDVEAFSARLERFRRGGEDIGDLETAVSLYKGDFLDGFYVPESAAYEAWLTSEREQLRQAQLAALYTLAGWHAQQADFQASMAYISQLLALDSLSESGQQLKMALLAQTGHRGEALAQYDAFYHLLREEWGIEPLPETTQLYEQIKSGAHEPDDWRQIIAQTPGSYLQSAFSGHTATEKTHAAASWRAQQIDWGEMPGPVPFYGRQAQLHKLANWVVDEQCRLIAITGMGGVGKTTLAAKLVRQVILPPAAAGPGNRAERPSPVYEFIIWRSLVNAPPLAQILSDWLTKISGHELVEIPAAENEQIVLLLRYLRERRCLLILDNFESLLEQKAQSRNFQREYEGFERLLQYLGSGDHQSCLLLTSRELPQKIAYLSQESGPIRNLALSGLQDQAGLDLLRAHGLPGGNEALARLVHHYSGNPLALKLVADTAQTLFAGDTQVLLSETAVFGDIREVLDEQFRRLTPLEEHLLTWLAIEREPVTSQHLWHDLAVQPHRRQFLEALRALYFRSLLEQTPVVEAAGTEGALHYALQNVVLEYATSCLIEVICHEIEAGAINTLQQYALVKANAREYVQESQRRLLLEPVCQWLVNRFGQPGAVAKVRQLLEALHAGPVLAPGYAGANILHLLSALGEDLRGSDFSRLIIRQADFRAVILHQISFRGSDLSGSIFRDTFGLVVSIVFSPDGRLLAAAASDGSITFWRLHEYQPFQVIQRASGIDLSIAFSPDGQLLASGSSDYAVQLWDVAAGREIRQFRAHTAQVTAVTFTPDGHTLLSASEDQTIRIWDVPSGRLLGQISTPGNIILTLAVNPQGRILAAGGYDGSVYLWEIHSGSLLRRMEEEHTKKIRSLAFSPDGGVLAAGGENYLVHLWQVESGALLGSLAGHTNFVTSLAFHPDGNTLTSGSADKTIRFWDWRQAYTRRVLPGSANWVTTVAYSPDGAILASGGYDRAIRLWQSHNGHLLHVLRGTLKIVNQVAYSPDGRLLASASFDQPVRVWDAHDGRLRHMFQGHSGSIRRLVFSPDGRTLAVSGDGQAIRLWDTQSGKLKQLLAVEQNFVRTLAYSPDGRWLAAGVGLPFGKLLVWDNQTGDLTVQLANVRTGLHDSFGFHPGGRFLVYSDSSFAIHLLNLDGNEVCRTAEAHQAPIDLLLFSPDGAALASQDRDGLLCLWRITPDGAISRQAQVQGSGTNADLWNLAFSADGQKLAFQLDSQSLGIFDLNRGQLQSTVAQSLHNEGCLAFSHDGRFLVTAGLDGRLHLWDATTGDSLGLLPGHAGAVRTMAVAPRNGRVASGGDDGHVRVWDIQARSCCLTVTQPGPYEGMDITDAIGLSPAQIETLKSLGAVVV